MAALRQLVALLIKIFQTKKRHPVETISEIFVVPLFFICIFTWVRSEFNTRTIPQGWVVNKDGIRDEAQRRFPLYGYYDYAAQREEYPRLVGTQYHDQPFCYTWKRWTVGQTGGSDDCTPPLVKGRTVMALSAANAADRPKVQEFVDFVTNEWCDSFNEHVRIYETNEALQTYMKSQDYRTNGEPGIVLALQFNSIQSQGQPGAWDYSIRFNATSPWDYGGGDSCSHYHPYYPMYNNDDGGARDPAVDKLEVDYIDQYHEEKFWRDGLYKLQLLVDRYIINATADGVPWSGGITPQNCEKAGNATDFNKNCERLYAPQAVYTAPMPIRGADIDSFYADIASMFPFLYCLAYMYTLFNVIVGMTREKELRIKESIAIMGISPLAYTSSWYIFYGMYYGLGGILTALVGVGGLGSGLPGIFDNCNGFLVWLIFTLFGLNCVCWAYMTSAVFGKARLAGVVGMIFFFMAGFGRSGLDTASESSLMGCMVLPQIAFFTGIEMLFKYQAAGLGVTWDNMGDRHPLADVAGAPMHSFGTSLLWLIIDPFILTAVGWYLHKVVPRQWGVAEPFYFLFTRQYWCPASGNEAEVTDSTQNEAEAAGNIESVTAEVAELAGQGRAVDLQGLTKAFKTPDGVKVAVDDVSLTMYEGQIFALLGHNGAGKTTLINIISGMLGMTAGKATILGKDVATRMPEIRKSMGVCPQHNILFPYLTVAQHLRFYGRIKGIKSSSLERDVQNIIADVALVEKKNTLSKNLSGGMKRKLHVAIALLGDSKVVFLDEPTSGMDSLARRYTWDLLRRKREGRIMVLTTHYMDEADQLGDRLCIMGEGKVMTCGSSLFLKNRFGEGYSLTMTKDPAFLEDDATFTQNLDAFVAKSVPGSKQLSNVGAEISYQLPTDKSELFPKLLMSFESDKSKWGVEGYGISITTMEEIFLRVARGDGLLKKRTSVVDANGQEPKLDPKELRSSAVGQAFAVYQKRLRYSRRDTRTMCCSLFTPILLVFAGLSIMKWAAVVNSGDPYDLEVAKFDESLPLKMPFASADPADSGATLMAQARSDINPVAKQPDLAESNGTIWGNTYLDGALCVGQDQSGARSCSTTWFPDGSQTFGPSGNWRSGEINAAPDVVAFGKSMADGWNGDSYWGAPIFTRLDQALKRFEYVLFYNTSATHSGPIFVNAVNSALAGLMQQGTTIAADVYPFPITSSQEAFSDSLSAFWVVMFITIALAFLPAGMAEFVVKERESTHNSKHLQMLSGCGTMPYWFGTLMWDFCGTLPFSIFTIVMVYIFEIKSMKDAGAMHIVVALLILNGLACPVFTYFISFRFSNAGTAQLSIVSIGFVVGFILTLVAFIMAIVEAQRCVDESWFQMDGLDCGDFRTMRDFSDSLGPGPYTCVDVTPIMPAATLALSPSLWPSLPTLLSNLGANMAAISANPTCVDLTTDVPSAVLDAWTSYQASPRFCLATATALSPNWGGQLSEVPDRCEFTCLQCTKPTLAKTLKHIYRFFPIFCVGDGVYAIIYEAVLYKLNAIEGVTTDAQFSKHLWKYDKCGGNVIMLAVDFVLYFLLTVFVDVIGSVPWFKKMCCPTSKRPFAVKQLDDDVAAEQEAMKSRTDDAVRVLGLCKRYGRKEAVSNLQFGIPKGSCFGLLGVNGAGKTTTMKCLTGDVTPTKGTAVLAGFDVVTQMLQVRNVVGYCPQFDGLHALMSVREHLELYARLKGVPRKVMKDVISAKMRQMDLVKFEHKLAGTLSGGNKRKLSVAIAIIGSPEIIFLDEPSSGMDPVARRFMWDVIADISTRSKESTVVLTTHFMEECEALCREKTGIMVDGQFKCLGSIQHLKNKFGSGFTIEVRVSAADDDADQENRGADVGAVIQCVTENFPGSDVVEQNPDNVVIRIPQANQSVAAIFKTMEEHKDRLSIKEYSVSQTTLEQIFNAFAATQNLAGGAPNGMVSAAGTDSDNWLRVGAQVETHSLSAAEKNNQAVTVVRPLDQNTGRVGVRFEGDDTVFDLKLANLRVQGTGDVELSQTNEMTSLP